MSDNGMAAAVRRAQAGDGQAFQEIYACYARRVLGLCRKILGPGPEVEEAVSEVFLKVHQSMDRVDTTRPLDPWILSIASNHCLNVLRRRGLEKAHLVPMTRDDESVATPTASPLTMVEDGEQSERLCQAMDALPATTRTVLVLRYQRSLSYQQIADETGLSKQNVAVLLHRARLALRAAMEEKQ